MNNRFNHYLCILLSIYSLESIADTSYIDTQTVNNEKITQKEISLMDPVCRLILIDKPGIHLKRHMSGREVLNNPQYEMAQNAPFLHHRCWALIAKQRYFSTSDKGKKSQHLSAFNGDMQYVVNNASKSWKFLPQIYTELGQMSLLLRHYKSAISSANNAINTSRTYLDAYVLLSDAYRGLGGSEGQAKKYILEGLKIEPGNKQLMRRAKILKLSIPDDLATPIEVHHEEIKTKETLPTADKMQNTSSNESTSQETKSLHESSTNLETNNQDVTASQPRRKNPYCRFCPD